MNVKFKMPKFGRPLSKGGVMKELLLTTIATTISIVLTFGTAQYFEHRQKEADARMLAMMVIHDMDNTVELLRRMAKEDAQNTEEARYVLDNLDKVDSLEYNLMARVLSYIKTEVSSQQQYPLDEASEKVFLSSQDSWKNIDNPAFIDAVQAFYVCRHGIFNTMNRSWRFRKPISNEAEYEAWLKFGDSRPDYQDQIKEYMPRKEVAVFLNEEPLRQEYLSGWAEECEIKCNSCKFAMGITDKELDEYVKTRQVKGQNVKEHQLIGRWIILDTPDQNDLFEFKADHTFLSEYIRYENQPYFNGRHVYTRKGKCSWELRGDSLFVVTKESKCETDASKVTAKPGMEKQTNYFVEDYKTWAKDKEKKDNERAGFTKKYAVSIDKSGTKIELVQVMTDNDGKAYDDKFYATKQEK